MEKIISIIIPCYNVQNYISRCLESIVKQDIGLECLDIICIDDCSNDQTFQYLKEFEKKYPTSIRVFSTPKNGKQGMARNIGLRESYGHYISFIDADDWIEPCMFSHMYMCMQQYDVDFVYCKSTRDKEFHFHSNVRQTKIKDSILYIENDKERAKAIVSNIVGYAVWDKLIKKDFLIQNEIWFPENLAYEDIYWGALLYLYAEKIFFLEEMLYHYFVNNSSTVLQSDQIYHLDIIRVNQLKREAFEKFYKGKDELLKEALVFDLLCTYYFGTLKVLFLRFSVIPYDVFYHAFSEWKVIFESVQNNQFIEKNTTIMQKEILKLLLFDLSKEEIDQLAMIVQKNGI